MKTVLAFWAATLALISGLLFWRNKRKYPGKTWTWIGLKSIIETIIVTLSAFRMPALLCAWISLWITKPIKAQWLRTTVGVFLGVGLAFLSVFAMEFILLLSVFSIDEITGENSGFLKNWKKAEQVDRNRTRIHSVAA